MIYNRTLNLLTEGKRSRRRRRAEAQAAAQAAARAAANSAPTSTPEPEPTPAPEPTPEPEPTPSPDPEPASTPETGEEKKPSKLSRLKYRIHKARQMKTQFDKAPTLSRRGLLRLAVKAPGWGVKKGHQAASYIASQLRGLSSV